MTNSKSTKRALFSSALAILVCVAMLVGTTFAWFTDTAKAGVNKIESGTLKVDIIGATDNDSITGTGLKFKNADGGTNILWEPGATFKTQGFRIANKGNLAFKYTLVLNGVNGDSELLDVIDFSVVKADGTAVSLNTFEGHLTANTVSSDVLYIQGHMSENAGNEYQEKELDGLGITVYATQDIVEVDSNNNQYDKDAAWVVTTVDELRAALLKGGNIELADDIDMRNVTWNNIVTKKAVVLNGNNHTISNLSVRDYTNTAVNGRGVEIQYGFGFIGSAKADITIKNLTFTNADVGPKQAHIDAGNGNIGGVVIGYSYGTTVLENVKVEGSKVSGYGKLGALIGSVQSGTATLTNCISTQNTIVGGSNMAGLIGCVANGNTATVTDCTVDNITYKHNRTTEELFELETDVTVSGQNNNYFVLGCGTYNRNANGYYYAYSADYYIWLTDDYGSATINNNTYNFCEEHIVNK